jgi:acyl-CoA synthetase (AMP-forming)/AMP-acid ligase II
MAATSPMQHIETVVDLLQDRANHYADARSYTFLSHRGEREHALTYRELARRAQAIGHQLQARDLQGERVLLLYPPGIEYLAAFYGCLYAGATAEHGE